MELDRKARTYVAGHRGLVGSAIWRELERLGFSHLIGRTHADLDLLDSGAVSRFFAEQKPELVFVAAARVGGIAANDSQPAQFVYENLQVQNNVIHSAWQSGVKKLLFLGSSCIYPRLAPQPLKEDYLLEGPLEPTNQWYAIAKIAGIKMCQAYRRQYGCDFISAMPTNTYGTNDNFDLRSSHVLPALIRKFHDAKEDMLAGKDAVVTLWGHGTARREFLHVDDAARAAIMMMESGVTGLYNVGSGEDLTIKELAHLVAGVVGYDGPVEWDTSKPDGTPRKLMDSSRLRARGWTPQISLEDGIRSTYEWYLSARDSQMARMSA